MWEEIEKCRTSLEVNILNATNGISSSADTVELNSNFNSPAQSVVLTLVS